MPRGPRGEKRPADVIGNAVHVMRIATGEIEDTTTAPAYNDAHSTEEPIQIVFNFEMDLAELEAAEEAA